MKQALDQARRSIVDQAQPNDREKGVAMLRPVGAVPAVHERHGSHLVRVGLRRDLDVDVVQRVEPGLDDPIAKRLERRIAGRIAEVGEGVEHPVSALPLRVRRRRVLGRDADMPLE